VKIELYSYQKRVKELLLNGKSVILQAPTGAGKTRAALAPFIEAYYDKSSEEFPKKCIYSVPLRVLASQFFHDYHELSESYFRIYRKRLTISIQTGDRPEDPKLESNLIFTTIDQTLSNFLNIPYGLGPRSANLNAGAIISSYLVFDELHLFDPDTTLPTTIEMLRILKDITPFIIMTATFSTKMLERLANLLDAVVIPENEKYRNELDGIDSQIGKNRLFHFQDTALTNNKVFDNSFSAKRTICICNTIKTAQDLYQSIQSTLQERGDQNTRLCLLHSRFYKDDRDEKESWIKEQFGVSQAEYDGPPLILIATQVIEVGVDATCDVMHTELAPAASLLQRSGRCARRKNETGDVYVYLPRDENGDPIFVPYHIKTQPRRTQRGLRLCDGTLEALRSSLFTGRHMDFGLEQDFIDQVHKPIDQEILEIISARRHLHRGGIVDTIREQDRSMAKELIRNINNRYVIVHSDPESDDELRYNPWYYDGFSFSPGTLAKAFNDIKDLIEDEEAPWIMKAAEKIDDAVMETGEAPSRQRAEYRWYPILESSEVYSQPILAIHPEYATYDKEIGIVFQQSSGEYKLRKRSGKRRPDQFSYHRETYSEHITGLLKAYLEEVYDPDVYKMRLALFDEFAFSFCRIENKFGLNPGTLDKMTRAIFACHDIGKLEIEWQKWAHRWQSLMGERIYGQEMSIPDDYMAAHTDFDGSQEQKSLQRKIGARPPHAGVSAVAASILLESVCDNNEDLWRAGLTAITRHHSAKTREYQSFCCHPAAKQALMDSWDVIELPTKLLNNVIWVDKGNKPLNRVLVSFMNLKQVILYLMLVRILRLADQRSQFRV